MEAVEFQLEESVSVDHTVVASPIVHVFTVVQFVTNHLFSGVQMGVNPDAFDRAYLF